MIFKRLISNIIDFLIFIGFAFVFIRTTNSLNNQQAVSYFYLVAFILTFILPIIAVGNTFGKIFLKLNWEKYNNYKTKLIIKYFIYFLTFISPLSFVGLINNAPFLNKGLIQIDVVFHLRSLLCIVISDITIFALSLGRYHLLDFVLNTRLESFPFKKSHLKLIGITFLVSFSLIISGLYSYKYNFELSTFNQLMTNQVFLENYPTDFVNSKYRFTTKKRSSNLVCPSKPMSFINTLELKQKTIYLDVPSSVFNIESERHSLCREVLIQSWTNDLFADYHPDQIRLILFNSEPGYFYEYSIYYYVYYYDYNLPEWGIYSGIKADSITLNDYIEFTNKNISTVNSQIQKFNNKLKEFPIQNLDSNGTDELALEVSRTFYFVTTNVSVEIVVDSASIELSKINFEDAELVHFFGINFPFQNEDTRAISDMFSNNEISEMDLNLDYLIRIRNATINEAL